VQSINRHLSEETLPHPCECRACWLGRIAYDTAFDLQKRLWAQRLQGLIGDTLLLLEHPPTLTLGKSGKLENLLVPQEELARQGVALFFTDRGGDVTYHGPGQLVAYPIIDLTRRGKDIHRYVHDLQEVVVRTLADYGVAGRRDDRYVGVWVGDDKIAAIGVAVHKWVSTHGLALNVSPRMEHFSLINPCGIRDRGVTSLSRLLGRGVPVDEVARRLAQHFATVFDARLRWLDHDGLEGD